MKSKKQPALACPIDAIGASACPIAAFSGFYESPRPPPSGDACDIVPPHRDDHQNGHQSGYIMHRRFVCCRPGGRRGDTEQSPGHAESGDALRIASAHRHGHQNGL